MDTFADAPLVQAAIRNDSTAILHHTTTTTTAGGTGGSGLDRSTGQERATALQFAARLGFRPVLEALLASGVEVRTTSRAAERDEATDPGSTPPEGFTLHTTCTVGFVAVIELLVRWGAEATSVNKDRGTCKGVFRQGVLVKPSFGTSYFGSEFCCTRVG